MTNLFDIIGYVGEVSEPNGPAVKGYFLDRWGQEANRDFQAWLDEHDRVAYFAAFTAEVDAANDLGVRRISLDNSGEEE
jgi:hypothetical protein